MNRVIGFAAAAVVGAAGFFFIHELLSPGGGTSDRGAENGEAGPVGFVAHNSPLVGGGPVVDPGGSPRLRSPGDSRQPGTMLPPPRPQSYRGDQPSPEGSALLDPDAGRSLRQVRFSAESLEEAARLAQAAFQNGENERAARLLHGIFLKGRHHADLDLIPQVRQLLELETDPYRRQEYVRYLVKRGARQTAYDAQLAHASALVESGESAKAESAWREITLAYELASSDVERSSVLAELDPFIQQMVFSGRHSPLLESYTIKAGDTLSKVAARYQTTADALVRLNRLTTADNIQPRMRLRVLPGQVAVFVDKSDFRLWLVVDGKLLFEKPVGLGRDNSTPVGRFHVAIRQKDPTWYRLGESPIPAGDPRNILGTRWLGFKDTEDYSGYGIHGTDDASSIGRESSAGCVRLLKPDVELLYDFVPRGTAVTIQE